MQSRLMVVKQIFCIKFVAINTSVTQHGWMKWMNISEINLKIF